MKKDLNLTVDHNGSVTDYSAYEIESKDLTESIVEMFADMRNIIRKAFSENKKISIRIETLKEEE